MRIGLLLGGLRNAGALGALAARAEGLGYDSLWIGDHIAFPAPILDPLQVLTCFAAHTRRVRLGTCVYLLPLRHPTPVAKMVASLDFISDGRAVLGVGVGGEFPGEFAACGVPVRERGARTDEGIRALRALWSVQPTAHSGHFYDIPATRLAPLPVQTGGPPIWIGGRADAAVRRAAHLGDGYIGHFLTPDQLAERLAGIRTQAQEVGRDPAAIAAAMLAFSYVGPDRAAAQQRAAGMLGAMYGQPMEKAAARYTVIGTPDDCRAAVAAYGAAGVGHMILAPLAFGDEIEAQIDLLASALAVRRDATRDRVGGS